MATTGDPPTETATNTRPRREPRVPARLVQDNAEAPQSKSTKPTDQPADNEPQPAAPNPVPQSSKQPRRKATVEEIEDPDSDIGIRNATKGPSMKPYLSDWDSSEEDAAIPPPSELGRTTSRSSMASTNSHMVIDSESDEDDQTGSKGGNDGDDVVFVGSLLQLWSKLKASVYAFFDPKPEVEWRSVQPLKRGKVVRRRYIKFRCNAPQCKSQGKHGRHVYRATEGADKTSMRNLRAHAEGCWGREALQAADKVEGGVDEARDIIKGRDNTSVRPPTKAESKANHVLWIAESKRPFALYSITINHTS